MDVAHRRLTPDFTFTCFWWRHEFGQLPTYILNEDTQPVKRAIGVSHTACEDEFRQNLRSHSWRVFSFFKIYVYQLWFVCVLRWGIPQPQSDWSLSCDHGLDHAS